MTNKKGFTIIELLAVMAIIVVIGFLAVPAITGIIENNKKSAYAKDADAFMRSAQQMLDSDPDGIFFGQEFGSMPTGMYYIPVGCIPLSQGGNAPKGLWDTTRSGVFIHKDTQGLDTYYFQFADTRNTYMLPTERRNVKAALVKVGPEVTNVRTIVSGTGSPTATTSVNTPALTATAATGEITYATSATNPIIVSINTNGCWAKQPGEK